MKDESLEGQELREFDEWMKALPVQKVGESFAATVVASAILMQKRNRSMKLLVWTVLLLSSVIVLTFFLQPMTIVVDLPDMPRLDLNGYTVIMKFMESIFMNSTLRLFYIVLEAILCLLIVDQIANYYQYIKKNISRLKAE